MKYSGSLLKKFISICDTPKNIADQLILKSCEIEEVVERKISDDVVIWKVLKVEKHPDADKLVVCQLDCGDRWNYQIVTWWENVVDGAFVPVAVPGCYLSVIDLKIEGRKMRWLDSNGMICSKDELWIAEDQDEHWIWILQNWDDGDFDDLVDADLWRWLWEKYPWLNNYIFDVENKTLTHRPDLTWHFGIATELMAMYCFEKTKISFNKISEYYKTIEHTNILEILEISDNSKKNSKKIISETDWLNSYILLNIEGITVNKSTLFTRLQLLDLGLEPRNNWIDFSNLYLYLTWQPVHFFDADLIDGDIVVRNAKKWEKFVDLFEKEHDLLETDLVITDNKKILALAGIIWSLNSWVSDKTNNIVVEIANFDPVIVRKTGTRLWLRTDAELRYEKDINPRYSLFSFMFFMDFLKDYQKDLGDYIFIGLNYFICNKVNNKLNQNKIISVDFDRMENIIFWKKIEWFKDKAISYLKNLWFGILSEDKVSVPIWRSCSDINIEEDIYEEVSRLYGFDKIESLPIDDEMKNVEFPDFVMLQRNIENYLVRNWQSDQLESYPWVDNKLLKLFGTDKNNLYSLQNVINPDAPHLRDCMVYNLVWYIAKNSKFFDELAIFDIGKVWNKLWDWINKWEVFDIAQSKKHVSLVVWERMQVGGVFYKKNIVDWKWDTFLTVKSLIRWLFKDLWLAWNVQFMLTQHDNAHPKKQVKLIVKICNKWESEEKIVWSIATLHPLINKALKISETSSLTHFTLYFDVLKELLDNQEDKIYRFETLQDQIVWRDLCFVMDENKDFGEVLWKVRLLEDVENIKIFDLYKGDNLWVGKKSVAFKFKIKWDGKMTTEQINAVMDKAIEVAKFAGWELRK